MEGGTGNYVEREVDSSLEGRAGRGTAEVSTDSPRPAREPCWLRSKNESPDPGGTSENGVFLQIRWAGSLGTKIEPILVIALL